jgi:sterol desaturase/sphingolipid hydroxylase (fatty acid hydroxylase superfamily)
LRHYRQRARHGQARSPAGQAPSSARGRRAPPVTYRRAHAQPDTPAPECAARRRALGVDRSCAARRPDHRSATPIFLLLIGVEFLVGLRRGRNTYRLNDALNSIGLGILSELVGVFSKLMAIGIYSLVFAHFSLWQLPADAPWVWALALLLYDLCYYWLHRAGHHCALLWAAHVVHHQSEDYNLSTALRHGSGWIAGWIFYLPLAVLGVPPLVFTVVALIDLLYQFWVHTQQVGKLGWFDRWFCSPSNHRAHHAVNERYLDRNYGGILIVWDRIFGTFTEEADAEPCVYGTRSPLRSWNPVWANLQVYAGLMRDTWHTRRWADKLRVWFMPPEWRPADVAARFPRPPFDLQLAAASTCPSPPRSWRLPGACSSFLPAATTVVPLMARIPAVGCRSRARRGP